LGDSSQGREVTAKKRRKLRLALVLAIILLLNLAGTWLGHLVNFQLFPRHDTMLHSVLMVSIVLYVLLMATPFMPGIEVGLAIMLLLGSKSALLIYLCTLVALCCSFLAGKIFPLHQVRKFLQWLYLDRASELVSRLESLDPPERLTLLYEKTPAKLATFLLHHRYAMMAIALNLPGNALIGGGGGIGLIAGMSRLIPFHKYLLVISIAVAPLPLCLYFQGV